MAELAMRRARLIYLPAFVEACARTRFTQEKRVALATFRAGTEEHIAAAYAAANEMRRIESNMAQHFIIAGEPYDRTIQYTLSEAGQQEYILYGRWFRAFLNEARSALESLMFEVVTALDFSITEREVEFYGREVQKRLKANPRYERLHTYLAHITKSETAAPAPLGSPRRRFQDLNDARRVSYHRRPYQLPLLPMIGSIGDEPLSVSGTHILLQDDLLDGMQPTFVQRRSVRAFTIHTIGGVATIAAEVYRLTARIMDRAQNPVRFAHRNRRDRRLDRRRRYAPPQSVVTYMENRHEEVRMAEMRKRLTAIFAEY